VMDKICPWEDEVEVRTARGHRFTYRVNFWLKLECTQTYNVSVPGKLERKSDLRPQDTIHTASCELRQQ
jgi:hypothetical protein